MVRASCVRELRRTENVRKVHHGSPPFQMSENERERKKEQEAGTMIRVVEEKGCREWQKKESIFPVLSTVVLYALEKVEETRERKKTKNEIKRKEPKQIRYSPKV